MLLLFLLPAVSVAAPSTLALLGVVATTDPGVFPSIGNVIKHPSNPLLGPGSAYTTDNGYLSVVHEPSDPLGEYRMWYDASPTQKNCIATANSSDGIHWTEPKLGLIKVSGSSENNCVVVANGLGVYRDPTEVPGSPALFKAFGGIGPYHGKLAGHGGTMISPDGLHWGSPVIYAWPDPPQRFDTSNNVFFDDATRQLLACLLVYDTDDHCSLRRTYVPTRDCRCTTTASSNDTSAPTGRYVATTRCHPTTLRAIGRSARRFPQRGALPLTRAASCRSSSRARTSTSSTRRRPSSGISYTWAS